MNSVTDWISALIDRGVIGLLVWSWQSLVLLTCVWLFLRVSRLKSPAQRYRIWLLSLIALAVLPLATQLAHSFPEIGPVNSTWNRVIDAPRKAVNFASTPSAKVPSPLTTSRQPEPQSARVLARPVCTDIRSLLRYAKQSVLRSGQVGAAPSAVPEGTTEVRCAVLRPPLS